MGLSVGRTVKGIMSSLSAPFAYLSLSHFCVLTIWALKIEDGKESMKKRRGGGRKGIASSGSTSHTMCPGLCLLRFSFLSSVSGTCAGNTQTCFRLDLVQPGKVAWVLYM